METPKQPDFKKLKERIVDVFKSKDFATDDVSKSIDLVESCIKKNDLTRVKDEGEKVIQYLRKIEDYVKVPAEIYKEISLICWGEPSSKQKETKKEETPKAENKGKGDKREMIPGKGERVIPIQMESLKKKSSQERTETSKMAKTYHGTGESPLSTTHSDAPEDLVGTQQVIECKDNIIKEQTRKMDAMEKRLDDRAKELNECTDSMKQLEKELLEKKSLIKDAELRYNSLCEENQGNSAKIGQLNEYIETKSKEIHELWGENASLKQIIELQKREMKEADYQHESKVRKLMGDISSLTAQRDDLRDRFSKVAGAKLSDNNAAIADLSDPNRAMKLAERFAAIYDDEWTDAFQEQKEKIKKKSDKNVVQHLLKVLVDCYQFCQKIADQQMDVLNNVLLHPCQDASLDRNISGVSKGPNQPRVHSKDVKIMKEARRKIATEAIAEVKEQFITKMRQDPNTDKKAMECSLSYYEKCAEICWHMVLHDPVLQLKLDVKEGDKMDLNLFTIYQSSGSVIEYLVWPPLFNGKDGGLLNKGVAQPTKDSGKASKK